MPVIPRRYVVILAVLALAALTPSACTAARFSEAKGLPGMGSFAANRTLLDSAALSSIDATVGAEPASVELSAQYRRLTADGRVAVHELAGRRFVVFNQGVANPDYSYEYIYSPSAGGIADQLLGRGGVAQSLGGDWFKALAGTDAEAP